MRKVRLFAGIVIGCVFTTMSVVGCKPKADISLKEAMKGKFLIGVAMNSEQITESDIVSNALITKHFNSIVAENCMKSEIIQPVEGEFDFSLADQFVKYGEKHRMAIIGHTLVWHSQAPNWFFVDEKGNPATREVLIERMKKHITTVVKRYKGRVKGWDVVNEAINDDGTMRESPFYKIIGEDYIQLAFQFAHDADPKAELYYNDYNMAIPKKREAVVRMVNNLSKKGIKVNGIGMQGHLMMDFPTVDEFEKSIVAFGNTGAKVMITELDLSILPNPYSKMGAEISLKADYHELMNPYKNGVPDSVNTAWEKRYIDFFKVFVKHRKTISRVTLWGLTDKDSWKNDWPIKGRTDYPLLFDRNYQPKPVVKKIMQNTSKP